MERCDSAKNVDAQHLCELPLTVGYESLDLNETPVRRKDIAILDIEAPAVIRRLKCLQCMLLFLTTAHMVAHPQTFGEQHNETRRDANDGIR